MGRYVRGYANSFIGTLIAIMHVIRVCITIKFIMQHKLLGPILATSIFTIYTDRNSVFAGYLISALRSRPRGNNFRVISVLRSRRCGDICKTLIGR